MSDNTENKIPTPNGDDLQQLSLLRDILFGPQINALQTRVDAIDVHVETVRTTYEKQQQNQQKEVEAFREALAKQEKIVRMGLDTLTEQIVTESQTKQHEIGDLINAILSLFKAQEAANITLIQQLQATQEEQSSRFQVLYTTLEKMNSAEPSE